jgi:peroxin-3
LTTLYSLVLLSLQTHIQLNLLGRYAYLTSVASLSAPASSSNHHIRLERNDGQRYEPDEEDGMGNDDLDDAVKGIDLQTERLYLTFSWWFLHQGWKELADDVKAAVEDVLGGLALKTQLTHEDFLLLLNKIRRRDKRRLGKHSGCAK